MKEIELEKTYLAKYLPDNLDKMECIEIADSYFPENVAHPTLRLRKRGSKYEITKKMPSEGVDSSKQIEDTIPLSKDEYENIAKAGGKKFAKKRYIYPFQGRKAEVDVYQDDLLGLVVVDFEFTEESDKDSFVMPEFCLADVTQEAFVAGGMLCGKKYADISDQLLVYGYKGLYIS